MAIDRAVDAPQCHQIVHRHGTWHVAGRDRDPEISAGRVDDGDGMAFG